MWRKRNRVRIISGTRWNEKNLHLSKHLSLKLFLKHINVISRLIIFYMRFVIQMSHYLNDKYKYWYIYFSDHLTQVLFLFLESPSSFKELLSILDIFILSTFHTYLFQSFNVKEDIIFLLFLAVVLPNVTVTFYWNIRIRHLILTVLMLNEKWKLNTAWWHSNARWIHSILQLSP